MTAKPSPPQSLRDFQQAYSDRLRWPEQILLPAGVPRARSQVYEELVFNGICGHLDKCFPISRGILAEYWRPLCRLFLENWASHTPIFSEIPGEFVRFYEQSPIHRNEFPWLAELLDYEWIELKVDLDKRHVGKIRFPTGPVFHIEVNPTATILNYQYPVHTISVDERFVRPRATHLLVVRTCDHQVIFIEINALTAELLAFAAASDQDNQTLLNALANAHPEIARQTLVQFGNDLIVDLIKQNILIVAT